MIGVTGLSDRAVTGNSAANSLSLGGVTGVIGLSISEDQESINTHTLMYMYEGNHPVTRSPGHSGDFRAQIVSRRAGTEPEVLLTTDLALVGALLDTLAGGKVGLDVEHSGYPIGHPDYVLRAVQLGTEAWAVVLFAELAESAALAHRTLEQAAEIVAHRAQADVIPTALLCGDPEAASRWFLKTTDTALLGALVDPHLTGTDRGYELDLKGLSGRMLTESVAPAADKARAAYFRTLKGLTNITPMTPPERSGWALADYGTDTMARYAASDVLDTAGLEVVLSRHLQGAPPALMARERATLEATARIAYTGLRLDPAWTLERRDEALGRKAALASTLGHLGVPDPASPAKVSARFAELGAGDLLPRTKTGQLSTDAKNLEPLASQDTEAGLLAKLLLAWRGEDTSLKLLLEPYAVLVQRGDGRARPIVQTLGAAATGRMSTVRPNLQQVSKTGGIRGCIVADPGHLLIGADFSSVEVRIAAALSGDENLATMLREGLDLHGNIAALVWGPDYTKAQRYTVKSTVFASMYGSGKPALARGLGPDGHRVDDVLEAMAQIMPGYTQWVARLKGEVRSGRRPVWRHPSGRLTYLPQDTPHKAPNYVIQSTGRELLVDALLRWEGAHPGALVLPIHDELLVQVPEGVASAWTLDLEQAMTTDLLGVPIVAESDEPTDRWRDAA